jgi:hypothetical protein
MEPAMRRSISHFEEAPHNYTYIGQPDIEKSFDVYCDASDTGIGKVLMQDGYAIAYASQQI